jgi:hypothetical protein
LFDQLADRKFAYQVTSRHFGSLFHSDCIVLKPGQHIEGVPRFVPTTVLLRALGQNLHKGKALVEQGIPDDLAEQLNMVRS